jgi:hypothetical protein
MGSIRRDQLPIAAVYVVGAVFLLLLAIQSNNAFGWGALVFFLVLAWWSWPLRTGRHISHADAQAGAGDDDVIVYWRPG